MKVAYVFMNYSAPSEVFGKVEVEALKRKNVAVKCFSILSKFKKKTKEVNECYFVDLFTQLVTILKFVININLLITTLQFCINVSKNKKEILKNILILFRILAIIEKIEKFNPDIVHLFWGHYPSLLIFLLKAKGCDSKISIFVGAYDLESGLGIMEWGVNNADIVFTHAVHNKKMISTFYKGTINVLYRGIKISNNIESKVTTSKVRFISVGRLDYSKRPDLVLKSFSHLIKEVGYQPELIFFGDGEMRNTLEKSVRDFNLSSSVTFYGHLSQKELFNFISSSDFMLFASEQKSERLPNSVKECMNLGCIPIVSKTSGIEELVLNKVNGFIVDFSDVKNISNIITETLNSPEKIKILKENAKSTVKELFDVDKLTDKRIELYNKVIK